MNRRSLLLVARAGLSFALMGGALHHVGAERVWERIGRSDAVSVASAFVVYGLAQLLSAARWSLVVKAMGRTVAVVRLFGYYLIGMFFNNCLPGSVGGDATKTWLLGRVIAAPGVAFVSIVVERTLGLSALLVMGLIATAVVAGETSLLPPIYLLGMALVCLVLLALARGPRLAAGAARFPSSGVGSRVRSLIVRLTAPFGRVDLRAPEIRAGLIVSVLVQALNLAVYVLLCRALNLGSPAQFFMPFFYPAITILALIPVSLGGLGVRESAAPVLLATIGGAPTDGVSLTLLWTAVTLPWALTGGLLFALLPTGSPNLIVGASLEQPARRAWK